MTPERLDAADRETTAAWMRRDTFSRSLAWTDLEVYRHDRVKVTIDKLATRWRWTRAQVVEHVQAFLARHPGAWRPAGLTV